MQPQDQHIKFFQEDSIADKYEEKYELYKRMIGSYMGNKMKAKYRELDEIIEAQKKQLETVKSILGSDKMPSTIDTKSILETLEAAIDSKISVLDMIKVQQKDQDALIKLMLAQDSTLDKWMDARKVELNQISLEKVLTVLYRQVEWIEEQTEVLGLAAAFRTNTRKEITKATNCGASIFDDEDDETGQKAFFKKCHELSRQNEGITYTVAAKILGQVKKDLKANPELNKEELIKTYIENENAKKNIAV